MFDLSHCLSHQHVVSSGERIFKVCIRGRPQTVWQLSWVGWAGGEFDPTFRLQSLNFE